MGMQLAEMREYSQLDAEQRAQSVLPGSHPPVKGFYLIKPSPLVASAKSLNGSPSLLTRLQHSKCSSTTHSLMPSVSTSELGSLSDSQEADVVDTSSGQSRRPDLIQSDSSDVVVNIDEAQLNH